MYKLFIEEYTDTKTLLNKVLKKYNIKEKIIYNDYGKPYIKNNHLYFSLSRCNKYTVCAISKDEIGVDIEAITYRNRVIKRSFTESEKKQVKDAKSFTKIWVKKEAYLKWLGTGISSGLKNVDTTTIKGIKLKKYKDYYIAIYSKQKR